LKSQALRKIVIVDGLPKYEYATVQILVALRVAMEDRGFCGRRARLRQLAVRGGEIENRAISRRDPALTWFGSNQTDGAIESLIVLGGLDKCAAQRDSAGPTM
jgi:hypothetical protein